MSVRALVVLLCWSAASPAVAWTGDLDEAWPVEPGPFARWLRDGRAAEREGGPWLSAARQKLGVVLERDAVGVGWPALGRVGLGWQRTRAGDLWTEHRLRVGWSPLRRPDCPLFCVLRTARMSDEAWPADLLVAVRPSFTVGGVLRIDVRLDLWATDRSWTRWARERLFRVDVSGAAGRLVIDAVPDGAGTPSPIVSAVLRLTASTAVGGLWDGRDGSLSLVLAVRRGPLMVRSRHAAHPVLGPLHAWSVSWTGTP